MIELVVLGGSGLAIVGGYIKARDFVRRRLRFVDDVQKPAAPLLAGGVAALAASPVAWLVPFIGPGAALGFGLAVGLGTRAGARDIRNGTVSPARFPD